MIGKIITPDYLKFINDILGRYTLDKHDVSRSLPNYVVGRSAIACIYIQNKCTLIYSLKQDT